MQINIAEAKSCLSDLIAAAEHNEEVIIARNGIPIAKIVKYSKPKVAPPGAWQSRIAYADDWNSAATNTEIEKLFAGTTGETAP